MLGPCSWLANPWDLRPTPRDPIDWIAFFAGFLEIWVGTVILLGDSRCIASWASL
jgi:hypothetical protein